MAQLRRAFSFYDSVAYVISSCAAGSLFSLLFPLFFPMLLQNKSLRKELDELTRQQKQSDGRQSAVEVRVGLAAVTHLFVPILCTLAVGTCCSMQSAASTDQCLPRSLTLIVWLWLQVRRAQEEADELRKELRVLRQSKTDSAGGDRQLIDNLEAANKQLKQQVISF